MAIPAPMLLTEENLRTATHWLADRDAALHRVFAQYGYPPLWAREPSFGTLVHIILEQQVSLASANAAFRRLLNAVDTLTPATLLTLSDEALRQIGFSRQKAHYARHLAEAVASGRWSVEQLAHLSDEAAHASLVQLKGVGAWTAAIYLSECLLRTDILPKGDIAMLEAFKVLKGLPARPDHEAFVAATAHWRPWRSVGSRLLWHFYLCERGSASASYTSL